MNCFSLTCRQVAVFFSLFFFLWTCLLTPYVKKAQVHVFSLVLLLALFFPAPLFFKSKSLSLKLHKNIFQFIVKTQENVRHCISVPDCTQVHILFSRSLWFIVKAEMSCWRRRWLSINFNAPRESDFTHCFISFTSNQITPGLYTLYSVGSGFAYLHLLCFPMHAGLQLYPLHVTTYTLKPHLNSWTLFGRN